MNLANLKRALIGTYDDVVDFNDLAKLAQNYNAAPPGAAIPGATVSFEADLATAFASVPEPGSVTALTLLAMGRLVKRRRRSTHFRGTAVSQPRT